MRCGALRSKNNDDNSRTAAAGCNAPDIALHSPHDKSAPVMQPFDKIL